MRIKHSEIAKVRAALVLEQKGTCPLCEKKFSRSGKKPALDHDHITGRIRSVLCIWCNGREGKVFNLARTANKDDPVGWLRKMVEYLEDHRENPRQLIHPTHKTENEKRIERNRKARLRRAAAKDAT